MGEVDQNWIDAAIRKCLQYRSTIELNPFFLFASEELMMSDCCSGACSSTAPSLGPRYRRILWIALFVNVVMFGVELAGGLKADSVSLLADAGDFFCDAFNYALTLCALALAPTWWSRAALIKGATMGTYACFVLGRTMWGITAVTLPEPATMEIIAVVALLANGAVALLLYAFRNGDANMRSVWLCARNDAIGNGAVILAAMGVFGTGNRWPDLAVALAMSLLGLTAAWTVIGGARRELLLQRKPIVESTQ